MIVAIIALLPGFSGQVLSKKALELAQWTALKEYLERCEADLKTGSATPQCKDVVLPPPPHINVASQGGEGLTPKNAHESGLFRVTFALVVILVLLCAAILVLEFRKTPDRQVPNLHWDEESASPQRRSITTGPLLGRNTLASPSCSLRHDMGATATGSQPFLNSNINLQHREGRLPHSSSSEYSTHSPSNNNPSAYVPDHHLIRQCPYCSTGMLAGSHRSGEEGHA